MEIPILTHLAGHLGPDGADSRNAINVLSAHRIIALPGGSGTRAEIGLALRYSKPLLAVLDADRTGEEGEFLSFLGDLQIPHQFARREGGWGLEAVREFLTAP